MDAVRVTLIDDDAAFVTLVTRQLEKYGYAVSAQLTASNGLRDLDQHLPHVLVTDLHIGSDDGWILVEKVKARHPTLPIVVITGYPDHVTHERARYWQLPVFIKPFDVDDLLGYLYLTVPPA